MGGLVLLKVLLHVHEGHAVRPGERPDWVADSKPEPNSAAVWLLSDPIEVGGTSAAILQPMDPERWEGVGRGTELRAVEGQTHVATAKVLSVYRTTR